MWVLTGDKVETAINIGYSCGLLNMKMTQFVINTSEQDLIREELTRIESKAGDNESRALIIAGEAFSRVERNDELRARFLAATDQIDVVIACRVSPKQKGDIV